jgi:hypothetical protein
MFMTLTEQEHAPVQLVDYSCESSVDSNDDLSLAETDAPPILLLRRLLGSKQNYASLGTASVALLRFSQIHRP